MNEDVRASKEIYCSHRRRNNNGTNMSADKNLYWAIKMAILSLHEKRQEPPFNCPNKLSNPHVTF